MMSNADTIQLIVGVVLGTLCLTVIRSVVGVATTLLSMYRYFKANPELANLNYDEFDRKEKEKKGIKDEQRQGTGKQ